MRNLISWCQAHRMMPLLLAAAAVVLLAAAAAAIWSGAQDPHLVSLAAMQAAYDRVMPGRTSEKDLVRLGFDTARYRSRALSELGVQEFFMPTNSAAFDRMDASVRACFDAQGHCRALVFPLAPAEAGLIAANAAPAGRMIFLLRRGRVAFKAVQGT
jgi:hypothetical protein